MDGQVEDIVTLSQDQELTQPQRLMLRDVVMSEAAVVAVEVNDAR